MFVLKLIVPLFACAHQVLATCAKDNLYNAFVNTPIPASIFCAAYTHGATLPPNFIKSTTYPASRYSSACSCIATSSTATTTAMTSSSSSSSFTPYCVPTTVTLPPASATTVTVTVTATISVSSSSSSISSASSSSSSSISASFSSSSSFLTSTPVPTCSAVAGNLIVNGDFEGTTSISPWVYAGNDNTEIYAVSGAPSGSNVLHCYLPFSGSAPYTWSISQTVSVCPNTQYDFSGWVEQNSYYPTQCPIAICFGNDCTVTPTIPATHNGSFYLYQRTYAGGSAFSVQITVSSSNCDASTDMDNFSFKLSGRSSTSTSTSSSSTSSTSSTSATSSAAVCTATSVIQNGDFEGSYPYSYASWEFDANTNIEILQWSPAVSGSNVLRLYTAYWAQSDWWNARQIVTICPYSTYTFDAWVDSPNCPITICFNDDCAASSPGVSKSGFYLHERVYYGTSATSLNVTLGMPQCSETMQIDDLSFNLTGIAGTSTATSTLPSPTATNCAASAGFTNGGFETGLTPWQYSSDQCQLVSTTTSQSGTAAYSLQLRGSSCEWSFSQIISVCPNTPYTITFWAQFTSGSAPFSSFQVCLGLYGEDCAYATIVSGTATTGSYYQYQRPWAGTSMSQIRATIYQTGLSSGLYVDNFALTASSTTSSTTSSTSSSTSSSAAVCTATSVLQNGDFEGSNSLAPWDFYGDVNIEVDNRESYTGKNCMFLYTAYYSMGSGTVGRNWWSVRQKVAVCPYSQYTLSIWAQYLSSPITLCFASDCVDYQPSTTTSSGWSNYQRIYSGGSASTLNVSITVQEADDILALDNMSFNLTGVAGTSTTTSTLPSPSACTPVQAIINGGFEGSDFTPWQYSSDQCNGNTVSSAQSGSNAFWPRWTGYANDPCEWNLSQLVSVCPNSAYNLVFYAQFFQGSPPFPAIQVCFGLYNVDCAYATLVTNQGTPTAGAYYEYEVPWAGSTESEIRVIVQMASFGYGLYLDSFALLPAT